jgi:hypothetical protein
LEDDDIVQIADDLADIYPEIASSEWDEDLCKACYRVVVEHVTQAIDLYFSGEETDFDTSTESYLKMSVMTGCRKDKFSLHIIMRHVYCECITISMHNLVWEIACFFVDANINWLMLNPGQWRGHVKLPEARFRVRALMVEKMVNKHHEMNSETGTFFFRGVDDSIFDEQIYQKNHNLRGVFARKASGAPALCPILNENNPLLSTDARMFPGEWSGVEPPYLTRPYCETAVCPTMNFSDFRDFTVTMRDTQDVSLNEDYLFFHLPTSESYAEAAKYERRKQNYRGQTEADLRKKFTVITNFEHEFYEERSLTKTGSVKNGNIRTNWVGIFERRGFEDAMIISPDMEVVLEKNGVLYCCCCQQSHASNKLTIEIWSGFTILTL